MTRGRGRVDDTNARYLKRSTRSEKVSRTSVESVRFRERTMDAYRRLEEHFEEIDRLGQVLATLRWDDAVVMPTGGADARAEQMATIEGIRHDRLTDERVGRWLAEADEERLDDWQRANLREMRRSHRHAESVPSDLIREFRRRRSACEATWRQARPDDDFERVAPRLQKVVEAAREIAQIKAEAFGVEPYDALLDRFEPGMTSARIDEVFGDLEDFLPGFIDEVVDRQSRRSDPVEPQGRFEVADQEDFAEGLMEAWGFDFDHGRLDVSAHPFCGGHPEDVRLTTNYDETNVRRATMAVLHETGHALYNRGVPADWRGQPVGRPRSAGVHESQALFTEMQVGRSPAFARWIAPMLVEAFGDDPAWSPENIHRLDTDVRRSLIRVDADEVTYPAHVMVRYRLEKKMIAGQLDADQLPGAFNEGMERLVGVVPDTDRDGCMQDVHWMDGMFGYFPTYTLGAMMAAQLFDAASRQIGDVDQAIEDGEFEVLLEWLRDNIHSAGSRYETDELLREATGSRLDSTYFKDHLRQRYLDDGAN